MSQRESGYERKERDLYETPEWVTDALHPHLWDVQTIWEPAAGSGKMVRALRQHGLDVCDSDIETGDDFLTSLATFTPQPQAIVTNPPYTHATEFIEHAHSQMSWGGIYLTAMLLRTDFDHAKTRQHLFSGCPCFSKKIVLTKRIKWFEDSKGSPSFNHAWYIWDLRHRGPPTLAYGPAAD